MGYFSKKLSDFRHRVGSIFSYSATDASANNNQWLDSDDSEEYRRLPPCILTADKELSRDVQTLQQKSKTKGTSLESKTAIRHHLPGRKGPATARLLENQESSKLNGGRENKLAKLRKACQNLVVGGKKEELNESELPPLPKVFKESDFQRLELLGSGADGKVWKAIHVATRRTVALKCMVMPPECEYVSDFDRVALGEVRANQVLDHPGILKTYGYYKPAPTEFVLVLEYCDGKTLTALSKKHGPLKSETVRKLFAQVVDAVEHCHLKRVAHRDIKLCNLMVSKKQELKLLDFGISTIVSKRFPVMRDFCGTATYMAPEIYAHRGYTVSAEIWSLGVALFTLLAGNLPFDGSDHEIEAMVQTCESHVNGGCDNTCSRKCKVKFPSHFSDAAKDLIGRMLTIDPAKRITIKEIKQHPWWNETKKERFHFVTRMKYRVKHLKVKRLRNKVAPEVVPAFAPEFLPEPILEIEEQREIPGGAVNKNRQWMLGLDRVFGRKGFKKLGEQKIDSAVNIHNPVDVSDQVSTNKKEGFFGRIVRRVIGVKKNTDCRGENGQEGVAVF